jgi:hypothetical protein
MNSPVSSRALLAPFARDDLVREPVINTVASLIALA